MQLRRWVPLALVGFALLACWVNWPGPSGRGPWGSAVSTLLVAGALIACIASAVLARSMPAVIVALVFSAAALAGSLVTQAPGSVPWVLVAALLPARALLGGDGAARGMSGQRPPRSIRPATFRTSSPDDAAADRSPSP